MSILLSSIFHDLQDNEQIYVWQKAPNARYLFSNVEEVDEFVFNHPTKTDLYFGVAPRNAGLYDSPSRVVAFWADVDFKGFKSPTATQKAVTLFPVLPTFTIESGHGLHLYWLLEQDAPVDEAQAIMRRLAKLIGGDAVHDPTHVLRLPDTFNGKDPNDIKEVVTHQTCLDKYTVSDMLAYTGVSSHVLSLISSGASTTHRSRSERDWEIVRELLACGVSAEGIKQCADQRPWGDRYREDPRLLRVDLEKAANPVSDALEKFAAVGTALYFSSGKGRSQVSTFLIHPQRLLIDPRGVEEDALLVTIEANDQTWDDVVFPRSAFSSQRNFLKQLTSMHWQWNGSDYVTRELLVYVMSQLGESAQTQITTTIGRHDDMLVTKEMTLTKSAVLPAHRSPWLFVNRGGKRTTKKDMIADVELPFTPEEDYRELIKKLSRLLPYSNSPDAVVSIVGWFFATPLKPLLFESGIRFPHLNVYGTMGSGKTSSLLNVFYPLIGIPNAVTSDSSTTMFVIRALLSSSNIFPVIFGEFRTSTVDNSSNSLMHTLRQAYDSGVDARGRPDQQVNIYSLEAPVIIDGEDSVSDGAMRERCTIVNLHPFNIAKGTRAYDVYHRIVALPLGDFAARYQRRCLHETPVSVKSRFDGAYQRSLTAYPSALPDRVRKNLAVVMTGVEMYNEFVTEWGGDPLPWDASVFAATISGSTFQLKTGASRAVFDGFVEDIISEIYQRRGVDIPFLQVYDKERNVLWVHMTSAQRWWSRTMRLRGKSSLEISALRAQLSERCRDDGYALPVQSIKASQTGDMDCFGLKIEACREVGLDVPSELLSQSLLLRGEVHRA